MACSCASSPLSSAPSAPCMQSPFTLHSIFPQVPSFGLKRPAFPPRLVDRPSIECVRRQRALSPLTLVALNRRNSRLLGSSFLEDGCLCFGFGHLGQGTARIQGSIRRYYLCLASGDASERAHDPNVEVTDAFHWPQHPADFAVFRKAKRKAATRLHHVGSLVGDTPVKRVGQDESWWNRIARRPIFICTVAAMAIMATMLASSQGSFASPSAANALTEENLVFLEAWRTLDRAYVDKTFNGQSWFKYRENALKKFPMNNREETYEAIKQMVASLGDPFTRFLPPEQFKVLRSGTQGSVTGVGLEVGLDGKGLLVTDASPRLVVVAPLLGGPAERAGIAAGDTILSINGAPTAGLGLYEAALQLQGEAGTTVELAVQQESGKQPKTFTLTRERVSVNPVSWHLCSSSSSSSASDAPSVGYVHLRAFTDNSPAAVREAILKLQESGATAFVLDMRNNSGGLFPAVLEISKMWLDKGVIVYIADSKGIRDVYESNGGGAIATREPLAVLVNRGTASASEILAGALKDNRRAVVLGEPTFGKGKIQSVFELSDGSGMSVTIARYKTPADIDIDQVGITPDAPLPDNVPLDDDFCQCVQAEKICDVPSTRLFPSLASVVGKGSAT